MVKRYSISIISPLIYAALIALVLLSPSVIAAETRDSISIVDANQIAQSKRFKASDASVTVMRDMGESKLSIKFGTKDRWPTVAFYPQRKDSLLKDIIPFWDLSHFKEMTVQVTNLEDIPLRVFIRVDSPMLTNKQLTPRIGSSVIVPAKQKRELTIELSRSRDNISELVGMQKFPQGLNSKGINPQRVSAILIFIDRTDDKKSIEISSIRARGTYIKKRWENFNEKDFFPFIDQYGQFKHANWTGKIHKSADFFKQKIVEKKSIARRGWPRGWDQYGGWKEGIQHRATGYFRTEKIKGKWWLIDPDGYLFWSHGIDAIIQRGHETIVTKREHYFEGLPKKGNILSAYLQPVDSNKQLNGFYKNKKNLAAYNFASANLHRKYGENWTNLYPEIVHRRLRYWGINTIGVWSSNSLIKLSNTPYVEWVYYSSPKVWGKTSRWKPLIDMWDSNFIKSVDNHTNYLTKMKDDPWLIGVFVDNEIVWSDSKSFANEVLTSANSQPAKIKFIEHLRAKYKEISNINKHWKSSYHSWADILNLKKINITTEAFLNDAKEFQVFSAEHYYKTIKASIKSRLPNHLYLCSRFAGNQNDGVVRAASKFCDVISFNLYDETVDNLITPADVDKPILIGEWHFGANDQGVFGSGLQHAKNQSDRVHKYLSYARSALNNPNIVGIHWFQYQDQMTTGRLLDGENHQIGFVSVTDTPYKGLISASQKIGDLLYLVR